MLKVLSYLKARALAVLAFCGDAGHRRAIAIVTVGLAAHFLGKEFDVDNVDTVLQFVLAAIAAMWTKDTFSGEDSQK